MYPKNNLITFIYLQIYSLPSPSACRCVCSREVVVMGHVWQSEDIPQEPIFFSTLWVVGLEFGSPDLAASTS